MQIYFAGSMRGGDADTGLYKKIIAHLRKYGEVLTEHVAHGAEIDSVNTDDWIYERDMSWLRLADVVVADVSVPSIGVGYEIAKAEDMQKRILCLYRPKRGQRLSAMISGNGSFPVMRYRTVGEALNNIDEYFKTR
ncbi:MAG: nucleoside 2-deoxyribosyltransferase [DPANN group archaeon]|nr:nucleoside 2-deoxyribosyltransferase [DPANN group archaeon]